MLCYKSHLCHVLSSVRAESETMSQNYFVCQTAQEHIHQLMSVNLSKIHHNASTKTIFPFFTLLYGAYILLPITPSSPSNIQIRKLRGYN